MVFNRHEESRGLDKVLEELHKLCRTLDYLALRQLNFIDVVTIELQPVEAYEDPYNSKKSWLMYEGTYTELDKEYDFSISIFYNTNIDPMIGWKSGSPEEEFLATQEIIKSYRNLTNHEQNGRF